MTTEPHVALAFLENRFDGAIPDDLRRAAEKGELAVSTTMPASVRIAVEIVPEHRPASYDALKVELRRAVEFVAQVQPWGLCWLLDGSRKIAFECAVARLDEAGRLRGALARVVRQHCGGASKIEFGGVLGV